MAIIRAKVVEKVSTNLVEEVDKVIIIVEISRWAHQMFVTMSVTKVVGDVVK